MRTTRDRHPALQKLRPLAAALAFATAPALHAVTTNPPGVIGVGGTITLEDGTRVRVAPGAWHQDALHNAIPPLPTATIRHVTNCNDDGAGSLREVLAASASGDTIDLASLACSRISLVTGAVAARVDTVTLAGPASRDLVIDGNRLDRVMLHYGAGTFTVRNIIVTGGNHVSEGTDVGVGGCIASAGYLTLDHSVVTDCFASGEGAYGGAIYAYSLIMGSSTLSANIAYGTHPTNGMAAFGGAAFVYQIDLVDSTITGNRARHLLASTRSSYDIGGGIVTVHGGLVIDSTIDSNYTYGRGGGLASFDDLLIRNSTISGNVAQTFGGGGIFVRYPGDLSMYSSTVTANTGPDGGGVLASSRSATVQSSIIAGNVADPRSSGDLSSQRDVAFAGANNLIGSTSNIVTVPDDSVRGDPGLLPLAWNGGPTRTHALRRGSPGIDAGNNTANLAEDQRGIGYPRIVGGAPDIGAFEFNVAAPNAEATSVPTLTAWASALMLTLLALCGARRLVAESAPTSACVRRRG